MFVFTYGNPFVRHLNWRYLFGQPTFSLCLRGAPLAAQGVRVLRGAIDSMFAREVVRCLRHRIDSVTRLHQGVDETPPESAVLQFLFATERALGFRHNKRSARHTFDASGNHHLCIAASDHARGLTNCRDGDRSEEHTSELQSHSDL